MLKLAGEFELGREKVEFLIYNPGLKNTGDLEAGTNTITPTSEASGTGNADYSCALTLPKPDDVRLVVKRICSRLSVNIAGLGTATHVYCRVYVDAQDADHRLFDEDWTSTGAKLDAVDTHSGSKSTIFNLLKDGQSHTFYFFFWADVADQATVDAVQLWEGVGSCSTSWQNPEYLSLTHTGLVMPMVRQLKGAGTGSISGQEYMGTTFPTPAGTGNLKSFTDTLRPEGVRLVYGGWCVSTFGTVATDILYLVGASFVLRSEQ